MDEYVTLAVHKEFADKIEREDDRQNKRISLLEESMKQIYTLNTSVEKIAISIETLTKEVGKQNERLQAIENKPARNWDKLLWTALGAIIVTVIEFVLKHVGI